MGLRNGKGGIWASRGWGHTQHRRELSARLRSFILITSRYLHLHWALDRWCTFKHLFVFTSVEERGVFFLVLSIFLYHRALAVTLIFLTSSAWRQCPDLVAVLIYFPPSLIFLSLALFPFSLVIPDGERITTLIFTSGSVFVNNPTFTVLSPLVYNYRSLDDVRKIPDSL